MGTGIGGNYNLNIQSTSLEDEDSYYCLVSDCATTKFSNTAVLTVNVVPTYPYIDEEDNGIIDVYSGRSNNLICTSYNGKPQPNVRWFNNKNGDLVTTSTTTIVGSSNELSGMEATFSITPTVADNATEYFCDVNSDAVSMETGSSYRKYVKLNVLVIPSKYSVTGITSSSLVIGNGKSQELTCLALDTGPTATLAWYRGNVPLKNESGILNAKGTYDIHVSISITANADTDGSQYSCNIYIPGNPKSYSDSIKFTVSVYYFPYAAIIGPSIGGIFLLLLLISLIFCILTSNKNEKRDKRRAREREAQARLDQIEEDRRRETEVQEAVTVRAVNPEYEYTYIENVYEYIDQQEYSLALDNNAFKPETSSETNYESYQDSIGPPNDQTYSMASSIRSARGYPVMIYRDLHARNTFSQESYIQTTLPMTSSSTPIYYTRDNQMSMLSTYV
uniref:nephrin-like n=1 Tax=Styela clava TaxID=7725 RepID=UPI00193A9C00|nr:nephrin-like [Styela clava]